MSMLDRLSPYARRYVVEDLAENYFAGGFSPTFQNGPEDEREVRIYQELVAVGLMEPSPSVLHLFKFTDAGLREILELRPMSAKAAELLAEAKRLHRPGQAFGPLMRFDGHIHDELVARGHFRKGDQYSLAAGA